MEANSTYLVYKLLFLLLYVKNFCLHRILRYELIDMDFSLLSNA